MTADSVMLAVAMPAQIEVRIYRTGAQGVDIHANTAVGVTTAWGIYSIHDRAQPSS